MGTDDGRMDWSTEKALISKYLLVDDVIADVSANSDCRLNVVTSIIITIHKLIKTIRKRQRRQSFGIELIAAFSGRSRKGMTRDGHQIP